MKFLLLLVAVPLLEIYFLIKLGGLIGAAETVLLIISTAVIGAILVRKQGFTALREMREQVAQNQPLGLAMLNGFLLFCGGALLLTPGFLTDALGFVLLIPAARRWLVSTLLNSLASRQFSARFYSVHTADETEPAGAGRRNPRIIDIENAT